MDLYELNANDGNLSSSSTSSSECSSNNFYNRKSDPSYCDTHDKDIKRDNRLVDDSNDFLVDGEVAEESESNLKLKRLRDCLHRIDQKYHKPIRIFNINFTENR